MNIGTMLDSAWMHQFFSIGPDAPDKAFSGLLRASQGLSGRQVSDESFLTVRSVVTKPVRTVRPQGVRIDRVFYIYSWKQKIITLIQS
jgi:hypothetical protein